jgi:hypothetical protein
VFQWVKQNSKEFVENGLFYWNASTLNHCRNLAAETMTGFGETNMQQRLREVCVEDELTKLMDMYGQAKNQKRFFEIIPSWFDSLLRSPSDCKITKFCYLRKLMKFFKKSQQK